MAARDQLESDPQEDGEAAQLLEAEKQERTILEILRTVDFALWRGKPMARRANGSSNCKGGSTEREIAMVIYDRMGDDYVNQLKMKAVPAPPN